MVKQAPLFISSDPLTFINIMADYHKYAREEMSQIKEIQIEVLRNAYLIKDGILSLKASANKLFYLFITPRFLCSKLIAWECQNLQTCTHTKGKINQLHPRPFALELD